MFLGIGLPLTAFGTKGGVADTPDTGFDPATLSPTAWYDPSDLSTLWQDTAGTTPVTADGQSVARMDDKSGNGRHLTQSTSAARPLYKTDGALHWLLFDGADDVLTNASAISTIVSASAHEAVCGGRHTTRNTSSAWTLPQILGDTSSYFGIGTSQNPGGVGAFIWDGGAKVIYSAYTLSSDFVFNQRHDSGTIYARTNSVTETSAASGNIALITGTISVGRASGDYMNGRLYGLIVKNASFGSDRDNAREWMAAKAGVTL